MGSRQQRQIFRQRELAVSAAGHGFHIGSCQLRNSGRKPALQFIRCLRQSFLGKIQRIIDFFQSGYPAADLLQLPLQFFPISQTFHSAPANPKIMPKHCQVMFRLLQIALGLLQAQVHVILGCLLRGPGHGKQRFQVLLCLGFLNRCHIQTVPALQHLPAQGLHFGQFLSLTQDLSLILERLKPFIQRVFPPDPGFICLFVFHPLGGIPVRQIRPQFPIRGAIAFAQLFQLPFALSAAQQRGTQKQCPQSAQGEAGNGHMDKGRQAEPSYYHRNSQHTQHQSEFSHRIPVGSRVIFRFQLGIPGGKSAESRQGVLFLGFRLQVVACLDCRVPGRHIVGQVSQTLPGLLAAWKIPAKVFQRLFFTAGPFRYPPGLGYLPGILLSLKIPQNLKMILQSFLENLCLPLTGNKRRTLVLQGC